MKAFGVLIGSLLLANVAFAAAEPKLPSCEIVAGTLPYIGPLVGITASSYNTSSAGGGYVELTGLKEGAEVKFILGLYTAGAPDNSGSAFTAFYDTALLAYENDYNVEIRNYPDEDQDPTILRGCTISLTKKANKSK